MNIAKPHLPYSQSTTLESNIPRQGKNRYSETGIHVLRCSLVLLSIALWIFAYRYVVNAQNRLIEACVQQETTQKIDLILDRLSKCEDVVQGGISMLVANGGDVSPERWQDYANSLQVDRNYPEIDRIEVLYAVDEAEVNAEREGRRSPGLGLGSHLNVKNSGRYPVSYFSSEALNREPVALDSGRASSRIDAAIKARDSGLLQMTGPITSADDSAGASAIGCYAPFYGEFNLTAPGVTVDQRRIDFKGFVYLAVNVNELIHDALEPVGGGNGLRVADGQVVLYGNRSKVGSEFDFNELFRHVSNVEAHGQPLSFAAGSLDSFRREAQQLGPWALLAGGVAFNLILIFLLAWTARSSSMAIGYAEDLRCSQAVVLERSRKLERSNADLEQFAAVASHDLKEPLRKVTVYCEMLQKEFGDKLDEGGQRYVQHAIDGARRMKTLIESLLTFARIDSEVGVPEKFNAAAALKRTLRHLDCETEESHAVVSSDDLPEVQVIRSRFSQLLQNLLSNSLKYRGETAPQIHVGFRLTDSEQIFSVSDNGIGIAPEYRKRVFGIFKRLHTRDEYPGTGIGLSICQRIAESWDGRIWIEDQAGPGCKVCFSIPHQQQKSDASGETNHVSKPALVERVRHRRPANRTEVLASIDQPQVS